MAFARANPAYYRVMFLPEVSRPESKARVEAACDACFELLTAALRENTALSAEEVMERAVGIWSTLHGLVSLSEDQGPLYGRIAPESVATVAVRIVKTLAGGGRLTADRFL
jgi:hypothetical protein